jgi:phosphatidylethanolamine-binding protein (PEBP) family uncharacterized protein
MSVVEEVYKKFGWNLSDLSRENMHTFLTENPPGKHGVHHYTLAQFGLDDDQINQYFKNYIQFLNKV